MKHLYKSIVALLLLLPLGATSFAEEPQKVAEPMQSGMDINQGMGTGMKSGHDFRTKRPALARHAGTHAGDTRSFKSDFG